jgi:hypothetical protein
MNGFVTHRAKWIRFVYSCFDRVVFNVIVPAWQWAGRHAHGFAWGLLGKV